MRLTRYEQETIILMNAGDKKATVYTADRTVMRRLDALVKAYPESYRIVSEDALSKTYHMPKTYVGYRKPRTISETKRQQARDIMKKINLRATAKCHI